MLKDVLKKLEAIEEIIDGTLRQEDDFTVKTIGSDGVSYTHDRENYLQLGLDITYEEVMNLIDDVREAIEEDAE